MDRNKDIHSATALVEAVLFLETEPLDPLKISQITGIPNEIIRKTLSQLQKRYDDDMHGITLVEIGGGYLFVPKQILWDRLKQHYGSSNMKRLSRAALETLSIVAYSQPVTRNEIESIRGVRADGMLRLLMDRELVKEIGKKEVPGKPTLYGTTKEFLRVFGFI